MYPPFRASWQMAVKPSRMFPPPSLIIPYGGFSPVRLEASPSRGNLPPGFLKAFVLRASRSLGFWPYISSLLERRRAHRPLAQRGLSCPRLQTLLRPDAPVLRTPPSLAAKLTLAGLCPRGLSVSPSLLCLVTLCAHATTSTPLAARLLLMVHPSSLGAFTGTDAVRLFQNIPSLDSER